MDGQLRLARDLSTLHSVPGLRRGGHVLPGVSVVLTPGRDLVETTSS